MTLLRLIAAESRLHFHRQRRYAFELIVSSSVLLGIFAGIAYGMAWLPAAEFLPGQASLALGFVLWSFASACYGAISTEVSDEMRGRTLEQLCIVARPLSSVLLARCAVQLAMALFGTLLMLHMAFWVVGQPVEVAVGPMLVILVAAAPSLIGVGLIIGGLGVLFKQVEAVNAIMLLGVIALIGVPAYPVNSLALLPFSHAAAWVIAEQESLALSGHEVVLAWVVGNSVLYFGLGLLVFRSCYRLACRHGTIGHI